MTASGRRWSTFTAATSASTEIADTLSKITRDELKRGSKRLNGQASERRSGTQRARNRKLAS
jgi:hypothetical protein